MFALNGYDFVVLLLAVDFSFLPAGGGPTLKIRFPRACDTGRTL